MANGAEAATDPVQEACAETRPAQLEVNVTLTCPAALVDRLKGPFGTGHPPFDAVSVTVTGSPEPAGCRPAPVSKSSVAVKVCGWPTSLVAFGAITIAAFTHSFCASGLSPGCASPVWRWRVAPPASTSVEARITVDPLTADVTISWQSPVVPTVVHGLEPTKPPGPLTI